MENTRQQKVNRALQKDLGEIFQHEIPHLFPGAMVTITYINITPDLSLARVNLSIFAPGKDKNEILKNIKKHKSEIRGMLGNRIKNQLRIVPELQFFIDESFDKMARIEELLKQ